MRKIDLRTKRFKCRERCKRSTIVRCDTAKHLRKMGAELVFQLLHCLSNAVRYLSIYRWRNSNLSSVPQWWMDCKHGSIEHSQLFRVLYPTAFLRAKVLSYLAFCIICDRVLSIAMGSFCQNVVW